MNGALAEQRVSRRRVWLIGIRPASLSASIVPVLVGTAAARAHALPHPFAFVAALLCAALIQIGTNFTNDVFDFRSGADNQARQGPRRLILSGAVTSRQAVRAAIAVFGVAGLLGLYLISVGGWPILIIGVLSIASGVLYTGGPWPLGYHGLGDLFAFTFFGPVAVMGSAYLQTLTWSKTAIAAGIPVGLLVTAILIVNNLRDIDTDRAVGKLTLAARIGHRATRIQYALFVIAAYAVPPILWLTLQRDQLWWFPWITLPIALVAIQAVFKQEGDTLNQVLKRTGQLNLAFGLLLALGLWIT